MVALSMADLPKRKRPVPGWKVIAAREEAGRREGNKITLQQLAARCEVALSTVFDWQTNGTDHVTWLGVLHALDLDRWWQPPPAEEARIRAEQEARRRKKRDDEPDA